MGYTPFGKSYRATAKNNRPIYLDSSVKVRRVEDDGTGLGEEGTTGAVSIATFAGKE